MKGLYPSGKEAAGGAAIARVAIAAGGTGGHVFPALAVADELARRGVEVHFLGTSAGVEARAVPAAGYNLELLEMRGLRGSGWRRWAALPWALAKSVTAAMGILRRLRPGAVLAMGGYAAAPTGLAARLQGRSLVLHEQNAVPGLTIRLLRRLARRTLTGFPEAAEQLGARAEWVGTPVRRGLLDVDAPAGRYAERTGPLRVLVFGGSQGAQFLNREVPGCLAALAAERPVTVWHQAGRTEGATVERAYAEAGVEADVTPFIDDMAAAYAWCDLVFCRAGAATVAELAAVGVPSVLVPFPHAVDDHQRRNAEALVHRDAAVCLTQQEWSTEAVLGLLRGRLGERAELARMAEAAREFARPDAARIVADHCLEGGENAG
ncbi:undecaprenyldiphospho-muramoylpentapeptide beta-N-acetylglucosaminyltransferase [Thiohalorhabdus methylotrophus]|uniref:UDP-N-acetylglucosamine--N-acetylmuramyl-(pentapeptide) pyrophosphoryl-undecaprenol N-acetylglucosamine transferase n=1 Tax=Thiohalorhabdus methylotrophus TaxID=3242694 RepID=A0ABV4TVR2_9GAMM